MKENAIETKLTHKTTQGNPKLESEITITQPTAKIAQPPKHEPAESTEQYNRDSSTKRRLQANEKKGTRKGQTKCKDRQTQLRRQHGTAITGQHKPKHTEPHAHERLRKAIVCVCAERAKQRGDLVISSVFSQREVNRERLKFADKTLNGNQERVLS